MRSEVLSTIPAKDRSIGWVDRGIAAGLALAYLGVLLATLDIGYTRDESFYFRFGQVYQEWFSALRSDIREREWGRNLRREPVRRTWSQNFEHPPLMKTLFGASWWLLAEKVRPVTALSMTGEEAATVTVRRLGVSEGFHEGARVELMPPTPLASGAGGEIEGEAPPFDPSPPTLFGQVTARRAESAVVKVRAPESELRSYERACGEARRAPQHHMRGCMAREQRRAAVMKEGSATRFPALLFAAVVIAFIYLFGVRLANRWVGVFAALAYAAIPRAFFHAHMAAFDVPVVAVILVTLYAFWLSQWSYKWAVLTGVIWGVSLLTKHNSFFAPIFLVFYWALVHRRDFALWAPKRAPGAGAKALGAALGVMCAVTVTFAALGFFWVGLVIGALAAVVLLGWRVRLPALPAAFIWMPIIGLPMLFLLWPQLWFDSIASFRTYVDFHVRHEHYMQYYFGDVLEVPPFPMAFPFVMTLLTVPVLTLAAFTWGGALTWGGPLRRLAGLIGKWRGSDAPCDETDAEALYRRRVRAFLGINIMMPILLIALPNTPIFGGVKHWLPAMPFFALVAGVGFDDLRRRVVAAFALPRGRAVVMGGLLAVALLLPAVRETVRVHPFGTSYYNSLAGSFQGAADLRLHRQFWGYASRAALPRLNREAAPRARIFFQNTTRDAFEMYHRDGDLRGDLRHAWGVEQADYAIFHHQKSFAELEARIWREFGTVAPEWQVTLEGVPLISVYKRAR